MRSQCDGFSLALSQLVISDTLWLNNTPYVLDFRDVLFLFVTGIGNIFLTFFLMCIQFSIYQILIVIKQGLIHDWGIKSSVIMIPPFKILKIKKRCSFKIIDD